MKKFLFLVCFLASASFATANTIDQSIDPTKNCVETNDKKEEKPTETISCTATATWTVNGVESTASRTVSCEKGTEGCSTRAMCAQAQAQVSVLVPCTD
jgi:hypothetical protein